MSSYQFSLLNMRSKINAVLSDDIFQTALWIGGSAAITAVCSYLLQRPELAPWYGLINFLLYAVKSANDRRKK